MPLSSDDDFELLEDDELFQLRFEPTRRGPNAGGNLILPRPDSRPSRTLRPSSQQPARPNQHNQSAPAVIDLTEEPDSPVEVRPPPPQHQSQRQRSRNPRRTGSQRVSPPRLERSDSTFLARTRSVIDLTAESPDDRRPEPPRSRGPGIQINSRGDELFELEVLRSVPRHHHLPRLSIFGRGVAGFLGAANIVAGAFHQPHLDVSRNAFAPREPTPKPPLEPPPPTRDGFTRESCADPELQMERVVVCPACDEELAYDPSGTVTQSSTGGKKRKRAPGEHHFWALKKCGHVYCADCFENRKPSKPRPLGVGFRRGATAAELLCVVEDCSTKVGPKNEWVGIFL